MSIDVGSTAESHVSRESAVEAATLVALIGGLWIAAGPVGVAIATATAAARYAFGPPYGLAVGFVGLAAAFPTFPSSPWPAFESGSAWIAILAYGFLLLSTGTRSPSPLSFGIAAVAIGTGLAGISWLLVTATNSLWIAGAVTLAVGAVLSSLVHRYERIAVGRLDGVSTGELGENAGGVDTAGSERATGRAERTDSEMESAPDAGTDGGPTGGRSDTTDAADSVTEQRRS